MFSRNVLVPNFKTCLLHNVLMQLQTIPYLANLEQFCLEDWEVISKTIMCNYAHWLWHSVHKTM